MVGSLPELYILYGGASSAPSAQHQFLQLPRHQQPDTLLAGKDQFSFHSQSQYLTSGAIHHVTPDFIV
ncbi:hypothetical protein MTR_7g089820 [Medicago truncatula]|uniref:Uncharacterized protein n=1 Tax=Medicago truncatula TaxID=3880 RepID=G7KQS4_MEDTR|nr:hypothetical protein MTR_7g089820 [Medicago truncatula]